MHPPWSDSDAKLLKGLRESAGLSQDTLAKRLVLSLAQVRELEGEDQGRFYSEQIKSHAGHRLLARLGHVPLNPVTTATGTQAPVSAAGRPMDAAPAPSRVEMAGTRTRLPAAASSSKPVTTWRWVGLVLVAAGIVLGVLTQLPDPSMDRAVAQATPAPASAPASASVPAPLPASPEPVAAAPGPVPAMPGAESAPATPVPASATPPMPCSFGPAGRTAVYQSPEAKRPSSYVYIESRGPVQVCIRDAQGRESVFELTAGSARNVLGAPPYTLQLSDWSQARVFFEGRQVRPGDLEPGGTALLKPFQGP